MCLALKVVTEDGSEDRDLPGPGNSMCKGMAMSRVNFSQEGSRVPIPR